MKSLVAPIHQDSGDRLAQLCPSTLLLGFVLERFPWRGRALGQLLPSQLPTQSPSLDHLVSLSLQTKLGDKELSATLDLLAPL